MEENTTSPTLFDMIIGSPCTLTYKGCKLRGTIIETRWIDGELNYHCEFPAVRLTKTGRKKPYLWSAIYPQEDVLLLN